MQESRLALTTDRIVSVCRELLIEGGPPAVVVREVARRLSVSAPALYKHASGRDDLLTLLIASLQDELATNCEQARDAIPADDAPAKLGAATAAFRSWALANRSEFALIYGQPIAGYSAPEDGPTVGSSLRFGRVFAEIYGQLLRDGRLRMPDETDLPEGFERTLVHSPLPPDQQFPPAAVYQFAMGFQRMLGLISVEVAGHLGWAMTSSDVFAQRQLEDLAGELILPKPKGPSA
ncbi:TetR/AcrR family transcriptional regulator [Ornithinimicrobium sp. Arc0846-15]|nr:TetR/AcrR family transcriptional regulator [Ornithinimicrobium laminariae]